MRWIWIDRFIEFASGSHAKAVKNVSLAEEHLHDHFPGFPCMPNSLILEGLAQTGGLLVGETSGFTEKVVLAKVVRAEFHGPARPGDVLTYTARINALQPSGAVVAARAEIGERLQCEAEIMFAFLQDDARAQALFEPRNFVFTMKLLGVFDVGRRADGAPMAAPPAWEKIRAEIAQGG
jgi:3-hydroxyacyl-[acyl-carrier-protein] dehydratase